VASVSVSYRRPTGWFGGARLRYLGPATLIITDYAVYQALPRNPQDADLILTVTYKNMAAFDDLQARTDPTFKQVFGSLAKAASASADRGKMRKEVGSQMVRQLILK
jgi:hypothetical protein